VILGVHEKNFAPRRLAHSDAVHPLGQPSS